MSVTIFLYRPTTVNSGSHHGKQNQRLSPSAIHTGSCLELNEKTAYQTMLFVFHDQHRAFRVLCKKGMYYAQLPFHIPCFDPFQKMHVQWWRYGNFSICQSVINVITNRLTISVRIKKIKVVVPRTARL